MQRCDDNMSFEIVGDALQCNALTIEIVYLRCLLQPLNAMAEDSVFHSHRKTMASQHKITSMRNKISKDLHYGLVILEERFRLQFQIAFGRAASIA